MAIHKTVRQRKDAIERLKNIGYTRCQRQREGNTFEIFLRPNKAQITGLLVHFVTGRFVLYMPDGSNTKEYTKSEDPLFKAVYNALYTDGV